MTLATSIRARDTFALEVYAVMPKLKGYARRLWSGNDTDAEDGMADTVCRALSKRHQFHGGNLAAWLTRIMRNIRRDQLDKGYRKGKRPDAGARLVFSGAPYARALSDLCDPESILIATGAYR